MLHKGKVLVFLCSALVILYGVSAAFYGRVAAKDDAFPALGVFMETLKRVDTDYVEAPDLSKVQEGAMKGLVEALDPYSTYLTKEQVQAVDSRAGGSGDVGMVLSKRSSIIYVVSTNREGPAALAGIRPGDYLVSVDGRSVEDASLLEVRSLMRGEPGTSVKAAVFRGTQTKPIEITMVRKKDEPAAVGSRMLDGHVGLLQVSSLAGSTIEQARVTLKTLISAGARKLILDVRDCASGDPEDGAALANLFLKSGTIYSVRGREGKVLSDVTATPEKCVTDLPLVVITNGSTAGPAEITAGALQANKRAETVGERSFGMASSQKRIPLKSGAVLVLSTAKFYTPDGKMIENDDSLRDTGIGPDVEVPDQDRMQDLLVNSYFDDLDDAAKYKQLRDKVYQEQLDKAVELLTRAEAAPKQAA